MKFNKNILFKILLFLLGTYLFTLGLSLYLPTAFGVMHLDFTIYSLLMWFKGVEIDGTLTPEISNGIYHWLILGILFFILAIISTGFLIWSYAKQGKEVLRKKEVKKIIFWSFISDFAIVLMEPAFLLLHEHTIVTHEVASAIKEMPEQFRILILLGGFLLNALGDAIWISSKICLGPYNSICSNFQKATNWNYTPSRIMLDCLILLPGILFVIIQPGVWQIKGDFFLNYLNIGTIMFVFAFGPIVHLFEKYINKLLFTFNKKTTSLH
ncbi:SPE_1075/MLC_0560 family membrane protein [Mesoplasma photuris]|uniref:SPE_1075/MLC_0560 family membrane protein n=1 Tax=Mesoplasma photuris TaxID=217731 RepID=UPI0004E16BEE|nr:hypothetical protein [Mesoplasma photuris]